MPREERNRQRVEEKTSVTGFSARLPPREPDATHPAEQRPRKDDPTCHVHPLRAEIHRPVPRDGPLLNIAAVLGKDRLDADGKKYAAGDVEALVQQRVGAREARHAFIKALAVERATVGATDEELALVREAILLKFRSDADALARLGLAPRKKRKKPTLEEKAAAAAKAKATRDRRHPRDDASAATNRAG